MMITEIGDVKRFAHPCQWVLWAGMDIRESHRAVSRTDWDHSGNVTQFLHTKTTHGKMLLADDRSCDIEEDTRKV
jgi:hypothetical protein